MKTAKLLIVDDDFLLLNSTRTMVEKDYLVALARSGDEALSKFASFRPDLLLLDINMPGPNGYEVCRELRRKWPNERTKIIFVSGNILASERLDGFECGGDDFIAKPFFPDELQTKIRYFARLKMLEEMERLKDVALRLICDMPFGEPHSTGSCSQNPYKLLEVQYDTTLSSLQSLPDSFIRKLSLMQKTIALCDMLYVSDAFLPARSELNLATIPFSEKVRVSISSQTPTFLYNSKLLLLCLQNFLEIIPSASMELCCGLNEEGTRVELDITFANDEPFLMPAMALSIAELCEQIQMSNLNALQQFLVRSCLSEMKADMRINNREGNKTIIRILLPVS